MGWMLIGAARHSPVDNVVAAVAALAVMAVLIVQCSPLGTSDDRTKGRGDTLLVLLSLVAGGLDMWLSGWAIPAQVGGVAALVCLATLLRRLGSDTLAVVHAAVGGPALIIVVGVGRAVGGPHTTLALAVCVAGAATASAAAARFERWWWHVAAVAAAAGAAGAALYVSEYVATAALVAAVGVAVGGTAFVSRRYSPTDSAAMVLLLVAAAGAARLGSSLVAWAAVGLLGVTLAVHGLVLLLRWLAWAGGVLATVSFGGVLYSIGTVDWAERWMRRTGVMATDVVAAGAVLALALGGAMLRRRRPGAPSWLTAGPAAALAACYLVWTAAITSGATRTIVSLTAAAGLLVVGLLRRRTALAAIGVLHLGATVLVIGRRASVDMPVWGWIALAGVCLLAIAVRAEQRSRGIDTHVRH